MSYKALSVISLDEENLTAVISVCGKERTTKIGIGPNNQEDK